ncbi:peptidase, M20/M25/M40 family protein [Streptococcus pneumoniae SP14-BS69]|nr:peptidase, M20/M25/M40 family protein [Streptococcus pneumoniae SP14-BS69]
MLDLIQTRRDLHQIPEIGLEEFKTQAYLLDVIEKLTTGKDFVQIRTWRTGIFGLPAGKSAGANHWLADRY